MTSIRLPHPRRAHGDVETRLARRGLLRLDVDVHGRVLPVVREPDAVLDVGAAVGLDHDAEVSAVVVRLDAGSEQGLTLREPVDDWNGVVAVVVVQGELEDERGRVVAGDRLVRGPDAEQDGVQVADDRIVGGIGAGSEEKSEGEWDGLHGLDDTQDVHSDSAHKSSCVKSPVERTFGQLEIAFDVDLTTGKVGVVLTVPAERGVVREISDWLAANARDYEKRMGPMRAEEKLVKVAARRVTK